MLRFEVTPRNRRHEISEMKSRRPKYMPNASHWGLPRIIWRTPWWVTYGWGWAWERGQGVTEEAQKVKGERHQQASQHTFLFPLKTATSFHPWLGQTREQIPQNNFRYQSHCFWCSLMRRSPSSNFPTQYICAVTQRSDIIFPLCSLPRVAHLTHQIDPIRWVL